MEGFRFVAMIPSEDCVTDFYACKEANENGGRFHATDINDAMIFSTASKALKFAANEDNYRNPVNMRHVRVVRVKVSDVPAVPAHREVVEA